MTQKAIETILKKTYVSCDPEECWNACGDSDKYGYIDVAVVFKTTPEIQQIFGDLIDSDPEEHVWIWAIAASKGGRGSKYNLAGMESGPRIDGRTNLAKAIKHLYDADIKEAKKQLYEELKEEDR